VIRRTSVRTLRTAFVSLLRGLLTAGERGRFRENEKKRLFFVFFEEFFKKSMTFSSKCDIVMVVLR
jgi:hypothetical protein